MKPTEESEVQRLMQRDQDAFNMRLHPMEHSHMVRYGDLSPSLKVFVVLGWIVFGLYALAILVGMILQLSLEFAV